LYPHSNSELKIKRNNLLMKNKQKEKKKRFEKIKAYLILILLCSPILYFIYLPIYTLTRDVTLDNNSEIIKGVVLNEKNYLWNDKVNHSFTYSYEFRINKKTYKNDSNKKDLSIGDSVLIEYYPKFPKFNRIFKKKGK
jgi:hypothetical protein